MTETSMTMIQQAEEVRRETISILDDLTGKAQELELPKPPEAIEYYRQKLEENTYRVLVVGEAKRGKSSFINALIGRQILPTDVKVATSQVFNVRPAEHEAFRLRLEDDSTREVTLEDLPSYGSQVMEDAGQKPGLDQIIRWIEVDEPDIRFLPKGVSLLDTPGLGALYAAHAQITHRFVPQANAVIFVLDSEKPIIQTEVDFIETLLDVTSDIFFIQTKIDLFDEEHWRSIQRRNQETLEEKFGNRLTDTNVWPISSSLLLDAANGGKRAARDLEDARHGELETALRTFLFRVAGWSRATEAVLVADRYRATSRQVLTGRLAGLVEDRKKRDEMQKQAEARRRQFDAEWGQQGRERKKLFESIRNVVSAGKKSFSQFLQPGGPIDRDQKKKIDSLESLEEAQEHAKVLSGEVSAAATKQWQQTGQLSYDRCIELLVPFFNAADSVTVPEGTDSSGLVAGEGANIEVERLWWKKLKSGRFEAMQAAGVVGVVGTIATVASGGALLPVAALASAAAGLWGWWRGSKDAVYKELEAAKRQLREHLTETMQNVRQHFLNVDFSSGSHDSRVDQYFATLERNMLEQVGKIAQQKEKEARAEHARLLEAGNLDDQQRKDNVEQTKRQLAEWDAIGKAIEAMSARLSALDQPLSAR